MHVVDLASPAAAEQCQVVEDVLRDLGVAAKPRITALNKVDLLVPDEPSAAGFTSPDCPVADENTVIISAKKKWGLQKLVARISRVLAESRAPSV